MREECEFLQSTFSAARLVYFEAAMGPAHGSPGPPHRCEIKRRLKRGPRFIRDAAEYEPALSLGRTQLAAEPIQAARHQTRRRSDPDQRLANETPRR